MQQHLRLLSSYTAVNAGMHHIQNATVDIEGCKRIHHRPDALRSQCSLMCVAHARQSAATLGLSPCSPWQLNPRWTFTSTVRRAPCAVFCRHPKIHPFKKNSPVSPAFLSSLKPILWHFFSCLTKGEEMFLLPGSDFKCICLHPFGRLFCFGFCGISRTNEKEKTASEVASLR